MDANEWSRIRQGIFGGESGGDYNALFNYQNRPGGRFADTKLTDMTVNQALDFASPSGPYADYVRGQVGRVATPMGAYQIVGSTLRDASQGLGLTGDEKMTTGLQERLGQWIYQKQGTGAWEGYKPVTDAQAVGADAMAALGRQSNTGGQRMAMQPTQRQGILGALGIQKQDRNAQGDTALPFYQRDDFKDTMGKLAVGFNSLTLRPDQNLAANVRANRQERQTNQRASQSMEWLSRQPNSEAYIEMLRAGAPVGQVLQAYQAEVSGGNAPSGVRGLRMQAEDAGLVPGTPEYQTFMLNGGGNPAAYRALVMQAKAAGYEPGTPEFERFMASRGAFEKTAQAEEARNRTDDEQQLIVMTRNLPGLYDVVDELAALASVATYTATGLAADNLARQLGQPMSEGATARAAYIATVDNQILPLLRQTFGAAFTAAEGDRLRATLGNDKGSPEEKMATLNAFIRGKQREIVALGGELPERPVAASPVAPDTPVTGTGLSVDDLQYLGLGTDE